MAAPWNVANAAEHGADRSHVSRLKKPNCQESTLPPNSGLESRSTMPADDDTPPPRNPWGGGDEPRPRPQGVPGGDNRGPWGQGSGSGNGPFGGRGRTGEMPDLDAAIAGAQVWLRDKLGGRGGRGGGPRGVGRGGGSFAPGRASLIGVAAVAAIWLASGFYRVEPDQLGVVQRFGAFVRTTPPGLNYHLPWPIETVDTPAVTRINRIEIGYRTSEPGGRIEGGRDQLGTDITAESNMLTGDENIIDIDVAVLWRVGDVARYKFATRRPDETVQSVAESVMREVIGRTPIQPALTSARAKIEQDVRTGVQGVLDQYGSGIEVTQVQLQKVDPPGDVIESFRDVQRASTDADRARNEAEAYRNDIVPRARGDSSVIVASADAQRQAAVAQSTGEAQRFLSVLRAYQAAKDVTLQRIYIETMQDILAHSPSVIVDDKLSGVVPYLPLSPDALAKGATK